MRKKRTYPSDIPNQKRTFSSHILYLRKVKNLLYLDVIGDGGFDLVDTL